MNTIVAAMGSISYPAISCLVSQSSSRGQQVRRLTPCNLVANMEQGAVQGMVTGIRSLCTGLGPALFGLLFQVRLPKKSNELTLSQYAEVPLEDQGSKIAKLTTAFPGM